MVGKDSFVAQLSAFVRCVEEDGPPPISAADGFEALRVSLAALQSLETGKTVTFKEPR